MQTLAATIEASKGPQMFIAGNGRAVCPLVEAYLNAEHYRPYRPTPKTPRLDPFQTPEIVK